MRIVEEDLVDWEPLLMRFIFKIPIAEGQREALVVCIDEWFGEKTQQWLAAREAGAPPARFVEYCGSNIQGDAAVEASADLIPPEWLQELVEAVERSFPDVDHLRLGIPLAGPTARSEFKWVHVPRGEVVLRGKSLAIGDVEISMHPVSVGQFAEFMRETGYRPVRDRVKGKDSLLPWLRINGRGPKAPVQGVSYGDAVAYCQWTGFRLPAEAELHAFFLLKARERYQFEWGGECWTADVESDDKHVACHGPYASGLDCSPPALENDRNSHPRDHYEWPFVGFRVARPHT